jgi:uncharacterized protein YjbI with pentapeptide repeats
MANSEQVAMLKKDATTWTEWRKAHPETVPDLSGADLSRAELCGADLFGANLVGADLSRANLYGANLNGAKLKANFYRADLSRAHLIDADLGDADLSGASVSRALFHHADLTGASLVEVNLSGADLSGANLSLTKIGYANFGDNDLGDVTGLETVHHVGPSMISIGTFYRSHGNIPLAFLRGAGVPDNFIEYMGSLTGKAFEFYSCFISYSTKDQEFAGRLHADLQDKGVRCWFAPHDIQAGKKIHEQIDVAIRTHEKLLLILSPNSMNSEWVKTEIRKARKRERTEKKRVLFPVRMVSFEAIRDWELFDTDEGKDLAAEIREYYIPDFSDWKNHDSYAEGLKNLLRDLKAEQSKAA